MVIDEKVAQMIFDAIAWTERDWGVNFGLNDDEIVDMSRTDFARFCREYGIKTIERKITVCP